MLPILQDHPPENGIRETHTSDHMPWEEQFSSQQLSSAIGSSVWVEVLDSSSSSTLEFWLTWIFADNHSHCELPSAISIPRPKDRISQHSYLSWLFTFFLFPLLWSSLNLGEGCIRMCHFLLSNHAQHLDQLWTSALTAAYCIEQCLWLQLRAV